MEPSSFSRTTLSAVNMAVIINRRSGMTAGAMATTLTMAGLYQYRICMFTALADFVAPALCKASCVSHTACMPST